MRSLRFAVIVLSLLPLTAVAAGLSRTEKAIVAHVDAELTQMIALLEQSVNIDSATENLEGVRAVGDLYETSLSKLGFATRWIEMPEGFGRAGHLVAERNGRKGKRILLIGHLDTVLEGPEMRWQLDGDAARGSGTVDMKGGNLIVIAALSALHRARALDDRRIVVYFTGDEEAPGRPISISRGDFIDVAKRSDIALGFEASVGSTATVGRRGVTTWRLEVDAVTAHSSGIFSENTGSGAIFEISRIIHAFHDELKGEEFLTFNASVIAGGTEVTYSDEEWGGTASGKSNVVPPKAVAAGDLRFISEEQRESVKHRMREIVARHLPRTSASITFSDSYPPMAPTEGNYAILAELDRVSRDLGYGEVPAFDPGQRGAGDISFVASYVDGLDGIGARGAGSHTPDERLDLASMPELIKRTAILIYRLTR
ncbi:MAG TPA: M20/M25/M40 family metallo-hydrolase [Thermoanaerobaculia bacterium]